MKFQQYDRYVVDFRSKWITRCSALIGVSLFVRVVYFFGLVNLTQMNIFQVIFDMILTMGLSVAFLVFSAALRRNAPGLYAIMGAGFCLLMLIAGFFTADALRIVLAFLGYILAGGVLVITVAGYLPGKLLSSALFILPMVVRVLFYDLGKIGIFQWVLELSSLLILAALFCLTRALIPLKTKEETNA
ncbi:MAG: hypothetical protein E7439_02750 [Ruminococcaceae bacterium]|nr:hypothetical protein [Oscillospiraceae bacterium]